MGTFALQLLELSTIKEINVTSSTTMVVQSRSNVVCRGIQRKDKKERQN